MAKPSPTYSGTKELISLGLAIKELRHELGISQEALAFEAGIDRSYISQLERGLVNPTFSLLLSLANALQVPLLTLIDIE